MSEVNNEANVVPVILCGGSGTRLWPESREDNPKQFLKLLGERSLLQDTIQRALSVSGSSIEKLVTVTLGDLKDRVCEQISELYPDYDVAHVLSEPSARDTAAAVALASEYVKNQFGDDAVMWILPADHYVGNTDAMKAALTHAVDAAKEDYLVTFGIEPTRPETGYGYIQKGGSLKDDTTYKAQAFVEKPDRKTAQTYLDSGEYSWNSGMFIFKAGTVLKEFENNSVEVLKAVRDAVNSGDPETPAANVYNAIEKQPFDKAIMEKSRKVALVPCDPEWSDIGSWESLWEIQEKDESGNYTNGRVVYNGTKNSFIHSKKQLIACVGLENIVVVETDDSILIADKSDSDGMKTLVNFLKGENYPEVKSSANHNPLQSTQK